MAERRTTGGEKDFVYSPEDEARIVSEDTESTKAFKQALQQHYQTQQAKKHEQQQRTKLLIRLAAALVIFGVIVLIIFLVRG